MFKQNKVVVRHFIGKLLLLSFLFCFLLMNVKAKVVEKDSVLTGSGSEKVVLFSHDASARDTSEQVQQPGSPEEKITIRQFRQAHLDSYLADEDFKYDREFQPSTPSLWQRIQQWFFIKLLELLGDEQTQTYWKWVFYVISGAVMCYVILKLTKTDIRNAFFGNAQSSYVPRFNEDNIHELDFEKLIEDAISRQQYNRAIRLFYLKTLKQLADRGQIDWRINKTNQDYLREISRKDIEPSFRQLTFLFEYIYYGDFKISQSDFEQTKSAFRAFEEQLKKAA